MTEPALALREITKRFGSTLALDHASLTARSGTVHALLGENGAGKTTLMRIAFGMLHPDGGTLTVDGVQRHFHTASDAIGAGIGMVHQHFTLVPAMTVAENIALGGRGAYRPRDAREHVREVSTQSGLAIDPEARVADLPVSAQQRVEILKALARGARILILDEPTAVLTPAESRELLARLRAFAEQGGTAILITHKLRDALGVADDITVLRHGRTVWAGLATETSERALVEAMVGASDRTDRELAQPRSTTGEVVLTLRDVSVRNERGRVTLERANVVARSGEIVGVAAVEGSGQRELLRVLAGRIAATTGSVTIPAYVGFVPEDRQRDALIPDFSIVENVALRGAGMRRGRIAWSALRGETTSLIERYDVRGGAPSVRARHLSGGNQQKLVVGRELEGAPSALVVENPSRGLDFNVTDAVHARLRAARDAGAAVVVYSPDLDELLALADRVIVVHARRVSDAPLDREAIGRAMLGATVDRAATHPDRT